MHFVGCSEFEDFVYIYIDILHVYIISRTRDTLPGELPKQANLRIYCISGTIDETKVINGEDFKFAV